MKAIRVYVYRNNLFNGCSNGGISERFDDLLLITEDGFIDIDENNLPENLVKMVERKLFGSVYKHIEPYRAAENVGWMSGGAVAYTSDARFKSQYPLCIHDRQETQEQYDKLSK